MQAEIVQWETEISAKCDYVINDIFFSFKFQNFWCENRMYIASFQTLTPLSTHGRLIESLNLVRSVLLHR